MADNGLVVIEGKREDWPGGPRTLTPRAPFREPNGRTFWFGAELDPDGCQVWFRITSAIACGMKVETPEARGDHLIADLRERMAKLEGALEGFLAGRRDRDAA